MRQSWAARGTCALSVGLVLLVAGGCGGGGSTGGPSAGASSGLTSSSGSGATSGVAAGAGAAAGTGSSAGSPSSGDASASGTGATGASGAAMTGSSSGVAVAGQGTGASGTSSSGTAVSGGSGAASGAGGSSGASSGTGTTGGLDTTVAVLQRNKHPSRDGNFLQPTLTKAKVTTMALDTAFNPTLSGLTWAAPLYLDMSPMGGTGMFFAATTTNDVYALDEATGAAVWHVNIGTVQMTNGAACIDTITRGILGTPVIDPTPGPDGYPTLYVAAAVATTQIDHMLFALSTKDGSARAGWPVNVSALQAAAATAAGITNYTSTAINQRSALSLVDGVVYVAYGSHGDCGNYHGWVVAVRASDPTKTGTWVTGNAGGAIWAPGGMVSDGNGIITVTGNGQAGAQHQDSEQITRLTGMGTLTRSAATTFYPTGGGAQPMWQMLDTKDWDLGSAGPVLVSGGGMTYVATVGKSGDFFLVNAASFGGTDNGNLVPPGGAYLKVGVAGQAVINAPASYTSSTGPHIVFTANNALGCPKGGGSQVMSLAVTPGASPTVKVAWCAPNAAATSPIITTSDGTADAIVWFVNGSTLTGVDADTGAPVVTATGACANVRKWTSPIAVKGRLVSAADGHLCSWSVH